MAAKVLEVGSTGGLMAAKRGECDIAGIHLMDPASGEYNRPFLTEELDLVPGYGRLQGIVFRRAMSALKRLIEERSPSRLAELLPDDQSQRRQRNPNSDRPPAEEARPAGYSNQAKTHNAVAAAIVQGRADWGVAIVTVAHQYGLGFLPLQAEQYDFVVPRDRLDRPPYGVFANFYASPRSEPRFRNSGSNHSSFADGKTFAGQEEFQDDPDVSEQRD